MSARGRGIRQYRHGKAHTVAWCALCLAVVAFMVTANTLNQDVFWTGIPPLFFLAYEMYMSLRESSARKAEERARVEDTRNLADQCELELDIIHGALEMSPANDRVYATLLHLAGEVRLFISLYRAHLGTDAVRAVLVAENILVHASLSDTRGLPAHVELLRVQIRTIKTSVAGDGDHGARQK